MFGDLVVNLTAKINRFTGPMNQARGVVGSFRAFASNAFTGVGSAISAGVSSIGAGVARLTSVLAAPARLFGPIMGGLSLIGASSWGVGMAANAEQAAVAFEVLLGSADKAQALLTALIGYASSTPYSQEGITQAAKTLLNFGIAQDRILPTMRMLGDIAAGNEQRLASLSLVFGQIASTGRLMGGDLLQLINAGFNPLQEIAKVTGESMAELKKRMEEGKIPFAEVEAAFIAVTSAGGRFYEMAKKQSETLTGLWSTFKDEIGLTLGGIAAFFMEKLNVKGWLKDAIDAIHWFRTSVLGQEDISSAGAEVGLSPDTRQKFLDKHRANSDFGFSGGGQLSSDALAFQSHMRGLSDSMQRGTEALDAWRDRINSDWVKATATGREDVLFFGEGQSTKNYIAGGAQQIAEQQQREAEERRQQMLAELKPLRLSEALQIGSRDAYSAILNAMAGSRGSTIQDRQLIEQRRQATEAKRAADELAKLNRHLDDNKLAVVENLDE